jgi:N utilization substance protein A
MAALSAPGTPLSDLEGVGPKTVEKIEAAGITSIEKLADMTPEQLMEIPGIGEKMIEKIHLSVRAYFEALETRQAAEAAEAAAANPTGEGEAAPVETEAGAAETAPETETDASPEPAQEAAPADTSEAVTAETEPATSAPAETVEPAEPRPDEE